MIVSVGQKLGNYQLTKLLGQGGFADVYLGEHIYLKTPAAIKVLQIRLTDDALEQFLAEARTIACLTHPNIIHVLDCDIENGTPFLVMSYAPFGSLRQRHPRGSILSAETIVSYVGQATAALQYAHDHKIIHRDIKPENLLLGNNQTVMLSDFGIAIVTHSTHSAPTHNSHKNAGTAGTTTYMAPEQFEGKASQASDQYGLGVVVYEWFCGTPPFRGSDIETALQHIHAFPPPMREKIPTLAPAIEQVVMRALAKNPQARFASVQDFAKALEDACVLGVSSPLNAPLSRRKIVVGLAGLTAVGLTALGIESVWHKPFQAQKVAPLLTRQGNPSRHASPTAQTTPQATPTTPATTPNPAAAAQAIINATDTRPTVASSGPGQLDLFVRGIDNALWHRRYDGTWHDWESLGGILTYDPAVASWGNGRLDVFVRGTNNTLQHKWYDGIWHDWESLGGVLTSDPAVTSSGPGRLDVFVRDAFNSLQRMSFDGKWHNWERLGGSLTSSPAAASSSTGQLDAVARGTDNGLWHIHYDGNWHAWESLGGVFTSDPAVISQDSPRLDVFVRGNDNTLMHRSYDGNWHAWESLGGILSSGPAAVSWASNRIDMFARSTNNTLQHTWYDGSWHTWDPLS